jgi:hypothetical protein
MKTISTDEGVKMQFFDDEKMNRGHYEEAKQFIQPSQAYDASYAQSNSSQEAEQYSGLGDAWNELLGIHSLGVQAVPNITAMVPPVASDPWNELLHAQGVQIIDLQQMRLHTMEVSLNDLDVEQALHIMQEQPIKGTNEG